MKVQVALGYCLLQCCQVVKGQTCLKSHGSAGSSALGQSPDSQAWDFLVLKCLLHHLICTLSSDHMLAWHHARKNPDITVRSSSITSNQGCTELHQEREDSESCLVGRGRACDVAWKREITCGIYCNQYNNVTSVCSQSDR